MIGLSITFVVRRGVGQLRAGLASLVHSLSQADHRRWNGCGEVELAALQQSPGDQQKVIALAEGLLSGATTGCR
jgi:hypothetical protein